MTLKEFRKLIDNIDTDLDNAKVAIRPPDWSLDYDYDVKIVAIESTQYPTCVDWDDSTIIVIEGGE